MKGEIQEGKSGWEGCKESQRGKSSGKETMKVEQESRGYNQYEIFYMEVT